MRRAMITSQRWPVTVPVMVGWMVALTLSHSAFSQADSAEKAQALLLEVKSQELERQIAAKRTELDRLNEDLSKARKEAEELQRSIDGIGKAVTDSNARLEKLGGVKTRLTQALEVNALRIEAEKLKLAGLKMLGDAQTKSLATLNSHIEDTDVKAAVGNAEMKLMSHGKSSGGDEAASAQEAAKLRSEIADLKRRRTKSERSSSTLGIAAREAMQAASMKLQSADSAEAKAKKRADELGIGESDTPAGADAEHVPKAQPVQPTPTTE